MSLETQSKPAVGRWLRGLEVDLRSLAIFRVALGLVLLADLLIRIPQLAEFYTDRGVLPREAIIRFFGTPWLLSVHYMSGMWMVQLFLFLVAVLLAVGFISGYRTRLCAAASWFLLLSMHARTPFVLHGGDAVLRLLMFWSIFVPLNARFSLDRALNPTEPALPTRHLSPASLALVFQICGIYWFAAAEKMHPIWLTERSAVYYALSLDQFATPLGKLLLGYPEVMRLMTTGTLVLELLGPILAISPFFTGPLRILIATSFIGFHAGLALTMRLDLFPWVCVAAWLVFLPGLLWDQLGRRRISRPVATITVFFDGGCGFCRRAVLIVRQLLGLRVVELREAQSDSEAAALMRAGNSWVIRDAEGSHFTGYSGFLELCRHSTVGVWLAGVLASRPVKAVGDRVYRWIAAHRTSAGRYLTSMTPPAPRLLGVVGSLLVLLCLFLATASFLGALPRRRSAVGSVTGAVVYMTMLDQSWKMFAPYPTPEDGWYVIEGLTEDGRRFDLWNGGGPPTEAKPADFRNAFPSTQWLAYLAGLRRARNREYRPYFGHYLCRSWNERHLEVDQVRLVSINYMLEITPPPGEPTSPALPELVWQQPCAE